LKRKKKVDSNFKKTCEQLDMDFTTVFQIVHFAMLHCIYIGCLIFSLFYFLKYSSSLIPYETSGGCKNKHHLSLSMYKVLTDGPFCQ